MCIIGEIPSDIIEHSIDYTVKEKSKNIYLQKIKSLEEQQEVLRKHIKDQKKLRNLGGGTSKIRTVTNKSTQSESGTSIKDYEDILQERNEVIIHNQEDIDHLRDHEIQLKNKFKTLTEEGENINEKLNIEIRSLKENEKKLKNANNSEKKANKDFTLRNSKLKDENDQLKAELDIIKMDQPITITGNSTNDMESVNEAINLKLK